MTYSTIDLTISVAKQHTHTFVNQFLFMLCHFFYEKRAVCRVHTNMDTHIKKTVATMVDY